MKPIWSSAILLNCISTSTALRAAISSSSPSSNSGSSFSLRLSLFFARVFFGEANSSPSLDTGNAILPSAAILATSSSFRLVFKVSFSSSAILICCLKLSSSSCRPTSWYWAAKVSCSLPSTFRRCTSTSSLMRVYLFLADFSSSCSFTNALDDLNASFLARRTSFS